MFFSGEEHTSCCSITNSPENTHTNNIQTEQVTYVFRLVCMYIHMYMAVIAMNGKRDHESEREQGGMYRRVWIDKRQ